MPDLSALQELVTRAKQEKKPVSEIVLEMQKKGYLYSDIIAAINMPALETEEKQQARTEKKGSEKASEKAPETIVTPADLAGFSDKASIVMLVLAFIVPVLAIFLSMVLLSLKPGNSAKKRLILAIVLSVIFVALFSFIPIIGLIS